MKVTRFISGDLEENSYVLADSNGFAALIDPGRGEGRILLALKGLRLETVFITHGHRDHIEGLSGIFQVFPHIHVVIGGFDAEAVRGLLPDHAMTFTSGGEIFPVGSLEMIVLPTPGHTLGSQSYYANWEAVFTGDTLFEASVGRTDIDGGNQDTLMESIKEQLFLLKDDTVVYPGHGESTSVGRRKKDFSEGRMVY